MLGQQSHFPLRTEQSLSANTLPPPHHPPHPIHPTPQWCSLGCQSLVRNSFEVSPVVFKSYANFTFYFIKDLYLSDYNNNPFKEALLKLFYV